MSLGDKLLDLRKKSGLSQEEVAQKINATRQSISKWECGQSLPDLNNLKALSTLYNVGYDFLISEQGLPFDPTSIEMIVDEIDWTKAWSTKYPILATYPELKDIHIYEEKISKMYDEFMEQFQFNDTDTLLILKDILAQKFNQSKKLKK